MKAPYFVTYILVILVGIMQTYSFFLHYFSRADELREHNAYLRAALEHQELRTAVATHELRDLKQTVATLMPDADIKGRTEEEKYKLRTLASLVVTPESLRLERASSLMARARTNFNEQLFEDANKIFEQIIDRHPSSIHVVEATFLLVEGLYQLKEYENALDAIETMLDQYPDNDLTGFAMIRMGKIFEFQDRLEDASDVYETIIQSYNNRALKKQAGIALQKVAL